MTGRIIPESQTVAPGNIHSLDKTIEIEITPNFENTAAFFATALRDHSFDRGAIEPIVSLIEQVRYLTQTDIDAVQRLIDRLNRGGR